MVAFRFAAVALAAGSAVASTLPSLLVARQGAVGFDPSLVPASCLSSQCQVFVDNFAQGKCITLECLCTDAVASAIKNCIQCAVDVQGSGVDQKTADDTVKDFVDGCNSAGHSVKASSTTTTPASGTSQDPKDSDTPSGGASAIGVNVVGVIAAAAFGASLLA